MRNLPLAACVLVLAGCASSDTDDSEASDAVGAHHGAVPWISQYDGLPNAASDCGPTTVAMAARGYRVFTDLTNRELIATLAGARGAGISAYGGTPALGMRNMANYADLSIKLNPDSTFERLTAELAAGDLIAIAGDTYALPYHYDPNGTEGHWILCTSYADGYFEIMDPADSRSGPRYLTNAEPRTFLAGTDGSYWYAGSMPIW
jgi:Peptidase_C39 like family